MNPSYTAYNKALLATIMNTLMGIEPPAPKAKKDPNVGPAFAKNVGVQQDEPSEEKEVKVQAHLDKLAAECKQRYLDGLNELPYAKEIGKWAVGEELEPYPVAAEAEGEALTARFNSQMGDKAEGKYPSIIIAQTEEMDKAAYDIATKALLNLVNITETHDEPKYPRSDMVEEAEEAQANAKVMTALYGSDNGAKVDVDTPHDIVVRELHRTHAAYIERRIAINRSLRPMVKDEETVVEYLPKYPTSDMIDLLHEHIAEVEAAELLAKTKAAFKKSAGKRAVNAVIHSGERGNLNYDNYTDEAL